MTPKQKLIESIKSDINEAEQRVGFGFLATVNQYALGEYKILQKVLKDIEEILPNE